MRSVELQIYFFHLFPIPTITEQTRSYVKKIDEKYDKKKSTLYLSLQSF